MEVEATEEADGAGQECLGGGRLGTSTAVRQRDRDRDSGVAGVQASPCGLGQCTQFECDSTCPIEIEQAFKAGSEMAYFAVFFTIFILLFLFRIK